jgi:hypothetical protein
MAILTGNRLEQGRTLIMTLAGRLASQAVILAGWCSIACWLGWSVRGMTLSWALLAVCR